MAEEVKKVTETPPPPPPTQVANTDDNRRRTRSQTRNGGITPPAPIPEPRGRKRTSQGQTGSASKRGKKATETTTTPADTVSPTDAAKAPAPAAEASKPEVHSEKAEPTEKVVETLEPAEVVDACKRKVEEKNGEKPVEPAPAKDIPSVENFCALPPKSEKPAAESVGEKAQSTGHAVTKSMEEKEVAASKEIATAKNEAPDNIDNLKKPDRPADAEPEQNTTSEQSKIDVSDEKITSVAEVGSNEKSQNNSNAATDSTVADGNETSAAEKQPVKIQESGDCKLEAANMEPVKAEDKTANNDQTSAPPV